MSEALSTSPASAPRPLPTWEATIAPLALPSIAMQRSGELAHLLGQGLGRGHRWRSRRSAPRAPSRRRWSPRSTPHATRRPWWSRPTGTRWWCRASGRPAARRRRPRRTAAALDVGSGSWAAVRRAMSVTVSQLTGPSCGAKNDCIWAISALRSGMPPPAPNPPIWEKICSNGRALEGVVVVGALTGRSGPPGVSLMASTVPTAPSSGAPRLGQACTPRPIRAPRRHPRHARST